MEGTLPSRANPAAQRGADAARAQRAGADEGLRDHAVIATLLGRSLRGSELLGVDLDQYNGWGFVHVLRKGGHVQKFRPIQR